MKADAKPFHFEFMTPEEIAEHQARLDKEMENGRKKAKYKSGIASGFFGALRYVFFTPLSIAANVVAVLSKFAGGILAVGMPYGAYRLYRAVVEIAGGAKFNDVEMWAVWLFVVTPFIAFLVDFVFSKIADFLKSNAG